MQVCHHCLKPLANVEHTSAQSVFCSDTCKQEATSAYHSMEAALDLAPLIKYCKHYDERFPLIVARAACMHLTHSSHLTKSSPSTHRAKDAAKAGYPQGDVWQVQLWQSWSKSGAHPWQQACTAPSCLPKCPVLPVSCAQYRLHLSASLDSHAQCPAVDLQIIIR